ncbi:hypothetical protein HZS_7757 [Henneguya salminicola]|nr:hypothetical protein HZS_7757 [Henneguya salminicola]
MALVNAKIRENLNKALARQLVSLEVVLSYHAGIMDEDVVGLMELNIPLSNEISLNDFKFDDDTINDIETIR